MADATTPEQYDGDGTIVHLHNHSVASALDGVATVEQYARRCLELKLPGMALTEHGNLASVPELYLNFRACGLTPLTGCELYYNDWEQARRRHNDGNIRSLRQTDPVLYQHMARNRHLTVLAKNEVGYHNLIKLNTQAYHTGLYGAGRIQYPRVWFEKLCEFREGLIVLSGCLNGPVSWSLRTREITDRGTVIGERSDRERLDEARAYVRRFQEAFGDDYYIELQMPGVEGDVGVFRTSIALAATYGIKTVITNDCHYMERKHHDLQKIMMAIAQETTVDSPDLFHVNSSEQYFKTRADLWATFRNGGYSRGIPDGDFHAACDNTMEVFDKCRRLEIDTSPKIPELPNADLLLKEAVARALHARGLHDDPRVFLIDGRRVTYVQQAKLELNRIIDKGFSSYFMITQDLVQHGKSQGFPFSPRGSASGSLTCFLLGISSMVDPMLWGLSFDRFLSPSRGGYMLNIRME